jgi:hypothetical protein
MRHNLSKEVTSMPVNSLRKRTLLLVSILLGTLSVASVGTAGQEELLVRRDADAERLIGTWALTNNDNVPFNLILRPDGSSLTVIGLRNPTIGSPQRLKRNQLIEKGSWSIWGNGVRSDYDSGWIDTIQVGPAGTTQWSWKPGTSLNSGPTNHGKAILLSSPVMRWVGAYKFQPAQADKVPYIAVMTSTGLAFNNIDNVADGSWTVRDDGSMLIQWTSGWRTIIPSVTSGVPKKGDKFPILQWRPGISIDGKPSATRHGIRI